MKDIITDQEDTKLEPFHTIAELTTNYGHFAVLEAFFELLECERQQVSHCVRCFRRTEMLHAGIGQLLRSYRREFPPRVEVVGEGLVQ
jgi:hypothetical protein